LPRIIVAFNALVFVLIKLNPEFLGLLTLEPALIAQGQVWRLVSYLFIPSFGGLFPDLLGAALYLLFLWFVGNGVEEAMGSFKLTLFYLLGMMGVTAAAFISHGSGLSANSMLNTSMFFAFARFYPEVVIYLFFILPVKVKWLAWLTLAVLLYTFLVFASWDYRAAMIASFANYFLFFGAGIVADARHRTEVASRRRRFEREAAPAEDEPLHRCLVCGRTEHNDRYLEFRVAKDGNEYCVEHLPKAGTTPAQPPPPLPE
jgi:hypothetical protein